MAGEDETAPKPERVAAAPEPTKERAAVAEARDAREPREPREPRDVRSEPPPPLRNHERARTDEQDELPETIRHRLERLVPELVKKTFAAGMGAVFSTEEGIRKIARESLPELAGYVASSADGAKDRVFEVIARETRDFLSNLNISEEIAKILTTLSFEIKTEIRFIPNSERFTGAEPDVKASVRLKRNDVPDKDPQGSDQRDSRSRLRFWQRGERSGNGNDDGGDDGPDR